MAAKKLHILSPEKRPDCLDYLNEQAKLQLADWFHGEMESVLSKSSLVTLKNFGE